MEHALLMLMSRGPVLYSVKKAFLNVMPDEFKPQENFTLTPEDVRNLIKSPFETKIEVTKKIANYYKTGGFNISQMKIAEEIFRGLVNDAEVELRKSLAEAIKDADNVPADLILELARDIQEVSLPVLQFSEVLTDADLIEIVSSTDDISKQIAIAKRERVGESVSQALIETRNEAVVDNLLQNENAEVSASGYSQIVENFSHKEDIIGAVVQRDKLPVSVIEHLANAVSEALLKTLEERHKESFQKLQPLVKRSREIATMKVIGLECSDAEFCQFLKLMEKLQISEDLVPIYALCLGNIRIFEICVARKLSVAIANVRTLTKDESNNGLNAIYHRADLPEDLYQAVQLLVTTLRELKGQLRGNGVLISRQSAGLVVKCVREKVEMLGTRIPNLDYIISLIEHNIYADVIN